MHLDNVLSQTLFRQYSDPLDNNGKLNCFAFKKQTGKCSVNACFVELTLQANVDTKFNYHSMGGAQWLSSRVLDSRLRGCWFEPHRGHWVVVLEQGTFILA